MPAGRVCHFVSKDSGETLIVLRNRNDASKDNHLAAGQAERICLRILYDADTPIEFFPRIAGPRGEALTDAPAHVHFRPTRDDARLREDLTVTLQAQRCFLPLGE